jgi:hypothetical protein
MINIDSIRTSDLDAALTLLSLGVSREKNVVHNFLISIDDEVAKLECS